MLDREMLGVFGIREKGNFSVMDAFLLLGSLGICIMRCFFDFSFPDFAFSDPLCEMKRLAMVAVDARRSDMSVLFFGVVDWPSEAFSRLGRGVCRERPFGIVSCIARVNESGSCGRGLELDVGDSPRFSWDDDFECVGNDEILGREVVEACEMSQCARVMARWTYMSPASNAGPFGYFVKKGA
jgi:hypothetical protein